MIEIKKTMPRARTYPTNANKLYVKLKKYKKHWICVAWLWYWSWKVGAMDGKMQGGFSFLNKYVVGPKNLHSDVHMCLAKLSCVTAAAAQWLSWSGKYRMVVLVFEHKHNCSKHFFRKSL